MGNEGNNDEDQKPVINFAFLIRQVGTQYEIRAENEGIPNSDVILILETWLEDYKEKYKKRIRGGSLDK